MKKKLLFAFCITIFSALAFAGPVDGFGFGYADVSIYSADALVDAGKSEVPVADFASAADAKSNTKISYKILPASKAYTTGVGLTEVNSQLLSPHNQTWLSIPRKRYRSLLQYEVGWRSGT